MKISSHIAIFILLFFATQKEINPLAEALFSPDDHPKNKLIEFIDAAKIKIYAAVYMFTDKDIAQALVDAKNRGVEVKLIVDPISAEYKSGQVGNLKQQGIDLYIYDTKQHHSDNPKARYFAPIMHDKFALIDDVLWTGSFNWTISANSKNQENVIIIDDKNICKKYLNQFNRLTQRCMHIGTTRGHNDNASAIKRQFKLLKRWLTEALGYVITDVV